MAIWVTGITYDQEQTLVETVMLLYNSVVLRYDYLISTADKI